MNALKNVFYFLLGVLMGGFSKKTNYQIFGWTIATKYSGGHRWLAHGLLVRTREIKHYNADGHYESSSYETQYYPLCNWGWGGEDDGYYLSGVFDTTRGSEYPDDTPSTRAEEEAGTKEYYYQYKLNAVIDIRK